MSVNGIPVHNGPAAVGFVILVYDLGYIDRREAKLRRSVLFTLGFLMATISAVTIVVVRPHAASGVKSSDGFFAEVRSSALNSNRFCTMSVN